MALLFSHWPQRNCGVLANSNMNSEQCIIRNARPEEFAAIGQLMVRVYSQLEGFPKASEQPAYYQMLANIGELTRKPGTELLVAVSPSGVIAGGVVYFNDMQYYGSGGTATKEKNAAGFRLLAVDPAARGQGIGRLLTLECIRRARSAGLGQMIIHSTKAMQTAWKMYEGMGFVRSEDLDFMQGALPVFGFRLMLSGGIPFQVIDWAGVAQTSHPGETGVALWRTLTYEGLRIRIVEYSAGYLADHWCQKGHILYCLEGEFVSELENGEVFRLGPGMMYVVSDDLSSHRSRTEKGVKLLIVDGEFLK